MASSKRAKLTREQINEAAGVVFLLVGLLTLVSLLFFHPSDYAFYTSHPNESYRNVTGVVGVYLSHALNFALGWSAYSIPVLLLFWATCFFLQKVPNKKWVELAGILVAILATSSLFALIAGEAWKVKAGGMLGYFVARNLETYFGVVGGLILSACCLALALILATDFLLYPFFERLWRETLKLLKVMKRILPKPGKVHLPKLALRRPTAAASRSVRFAPEPPKVRKYTAEGNAAYAEKAGRTQALRDAVKEPAAEGKTLAKEKKQKLDKETASSPKPVKEAAEEAIRVEERAPIANYRLPHKELLKLPVPGLDTSDDDLQGNSRILEETMRDFGIEVKVTEIEQGPVITRYEVLPAPGVKVNRIVSLGDDLALALKATSVRFIAPIPGKAAIGIEVPNSKCATVTLRELVDTSEFAKGKARLPLLLGKETSGKPMLADLVDMPHLLIAGTTGSGKTVCVNSLVAGLLYAKTPDELKFVMIDPKMVELSAFRNIPHMLAPVVTDVRRASGTLNWLVAEMERRYRLFAHCGTRNIEAFNQRTVEPGFQEDFDMEIPAKLPYIVLIIDELADLMAVAQDKVENAIMRLAQLSRAVGIHLILATQRPSVDVITGVIKANFPARISFKVSSKVDSRTVLDTIGADKLLGRGDMLFMKPGEAKPIRGQAPLITDPEINAVIHFIKKQQGPQYSPDLESISDGKTRLHVTEKDELYDDAVQVVLETHQASVSVLQRKLRLGYGRAARIIDMLEQEGIVGPPQGSKPREILVDRLEDAAGISQEGVDAEA